MIANYIDQLIMGLVGIWMTLVGLGYLPRPGAQNPNAPLSAVQLMNHFKWMGPLLIAIAAFLAIAG